MATTFGVTAVAVAAADTTLVNPGANTTAVVQQVRLARSAGSGTATVVLELLPGGSTPARALGSMTVSGAEAVVLTGPVVVPSGGTLHARRGSADAAVDAVCSHVLIT